MMDHDFPFWVDGDRIKVRFVSAAVLGRTAAGHMVAGDYTNREIRIFRGEIRHAQRAVFWHEVGHYIYERLELTKSAHEEQIVDLLTFVPLIIGDNRNGALRKFLGLEKTDGDR